MAVNSVLPPFPWFPDNAGAPLENGYVYIGVAGFEARTTPKASFFDVDQTIPTGTASGAAIRTMAGFPVRNGSPAMFYVDGDFSMSVCDRNGVLLYSTLNTTLALNIGGTVGPILAPDGNLAATGFGFINEPNTGLVRSGAGTVQDVVTGVVVSQRTAAGTVFQQPVSGAGFTGAVAAIAQPLDADLTALAAESTTGIRVRTGAGTTALRTITAGAGISVSNGDGVSGNPTISATVSDWVEVSGSPFTLSGSAPYNITTGVDYKHLRVVGIGVTASAAGNRRFRIGNSGGFLSTSIYQQIQGSALGFVDITDSTTAGRQFIIEIQDFNTTNAVKPVIMIGANAASGWCPAISDSSAFDRIQIDNSAAATLGGTLRVYGKN